MKNNNLQIQTSTSLDGTLSAISNSSIFLNKNQVLFKKDGYVVDERGIRNAKTGEALTKAINIKEFQVINKNLINKNNIILQVEDFVGSGASGSVHRVIHKPTGKLYAIKSIKIYDKNTRDQFKNDLKVLSQNKCQNIVAFYGAFFTEGNVKILLEYMNMDSLEKALKRIKSKKLKPPCIPENILSIMTRQILLGLYHLHKEKLIHRDIKPANILINSDGFVKLTDFGISRTLESYQNFSHTFVGSRSYMSPERITGNNYSFPSDIWSVGLVIYELATGEEPYGDGRDFLTQITKIVENPEPRLNSNIFSKEFCDFIEKTVNKEPGKRLTAEELLKHPWITEHQNDSYILVQNWLDEFYVHDH